ncbi:hypothetical protein HC62_10715 [Acetobacter tropicalis]|uniref:Uncharacterized protein n=1 Tax=Acetobacter tropicalis TaxID=104102 RepID=A0A252A7L1_9PROT|nr:hypothetical protein HC62_10715 [Acetobacter tropicalis]
MKDKKVPLCRRFVVTESMLQKDNKSSKQIRDRNFGIAKNTWLISDEWATHSNAVGIGGT